jgi:O-antigen/teichoic acid export membrane protein
MGDPGWQPPSVRIPSVVGQATIISPGELVVQNDRPSGGADRRYLRGSSLLLAGRLISVLLNLAVQVLTVRYLAKNDYGAFAYALAVVSMGSSAIHLGMDKAIPRLVPIYFERKDYARTFGSIALATGTIWGLGISLVVLLFGFRGVVGGTVVTDPQSLALLLILITLSPIGAYTTLLEKLVAVFARPRDIFFRRHVLGPALKLVAVLAVILTAGDVYLLAYGYLAGGSIGVWLYLTILVREWRRQGLLRYMRPQQLKLPARELFGFSLPLYSTQISLILRGSLVVILLEYFQTTTAVAEYRAVLSVAGLNLIVYQAFYMLFVPVASRMFAREDREGISELYWKTSTWITVLTFPVFAITCSLAEPVTVLLFGDQYAGAGTLLAILAIGHYFHAALGFNAAALRVHGKLRYLVLNDVLAAIVAMGLSLLLIPRYGATGAAISTAATLILHNIFNQIALQVGDTGIRLLEWRFVGVYITSMLVMAALLLGQWLVAPPVYLSFALAAAVSLLLIRLTRRALNPADTFPELLRIPFVRQLLT